MGHGHGAAMWDRDKGCECGMETWDSDGEQMSDGDVDTE